MAKALITGLDATLPLGNCNSTLESPNRAKSGAIRRGCRPRPGLYLRRYEGLMTSTPLVKPGPWAVREADFPAQGSPAQQLEFLLQYAVLAPSSHNSQPWLFRIDGDAVELYADRSRGLPVVDPDDRELTISCGAALLNLRIAMRHFGRRDVVELLAKPHDSDLLARVRAGDPYNATPEDQLLFRSIPKRRTVRVKFEDRTLPDAMLVDLQTAARIEGASLEIVRGETRRGAVVDLVAEGDRVQMSNKSFRRELAAWVRPNRSSAKDGIPGYGFGLTDFLSVGGPFVLRTFDLGGFQAAKDRELADGSPVLAVLSTEADTTRDWLAAGQALQRILLHARSHEICASFLNQPVELEELRPHLRDALDLTGFPQLVLRMGYGQDVRPTPRRDVNEVLIT